MKEKVERKVFNEIPRVSSIFGYMKHNFISTLHIFPPFRRSTTFRSWVLMTEEINSRKYGGKMPRLLERGERHS